jgi:hypothetical protein
MHLKLSLFLILFISFSSSAAEPIDIVDIKKTPQEELERFASLPSEDDVLEKAIKNMNSALSMAKAPDNVLINRVYASNLYHITLDEQKYFIDETASYWVPDKGEGAFLFSNSVSRVSVSNDVREYLMELTSFLSKAYESLVVYKPMKGNRNEVIYAFMDLSCPHCKSFHLTKRVSLQMAGYTVVYLPFMRTPSDKKTRLVTEYLYCLKNNEDKMEFLNQAYLERKIKTVAARLPQEKSCETLNNAIVNGVLSLGEQFNLAGSPVFFTEQGRIFYGYSAIAREKLK